MSKYPEIDYVDTQLAELGVCWECKQPFEHDVFYFRVGDGSRLAPARCFCIGCVALRVCDPR